MISLFQLIRKSDGLRMKAVACTREDMAKQLAKHFAGKLDEVVVLVLIEDVDQEEWEFSLTPLYSAETFVNHFNPKEVSANG